MNKAIVTKKIPALSKYIEDDAGIQAIDQGMSGSEIYKIANEKEKLILKITERSKVPEYLLDEYPNIVESEYLFYHEIFPELNFPAPRIIDTGRLSKEGTYLLMEDLSLKYQIPDENYSWKDSDLYSILKAYSEFHGKGIDILRTSDHHRWLSEDPRRQFKQIDLMEWLEKLLAFSTTNDRVRPLIEDPRLSKLIQRVSCSLDHAETTILYNDFNALNVGLPKKGNIAVLIDWQLIGKGPWQVDLCDIGFLNHANHFDVDNKREFLDFYLDHLAEATGERFNTDRTLEECRYASLMRWGVFLPTIVKAVERSITKGKEINQWMNSQFNDCIHEWKKGLELIPSMNDHGRGNIII